MREGVGDRLARGTVLVWLAAALLTACGPSSSGHPDSGPNVPDGSVQPDGGTPDGGGDGGADAGDGGADGGSVPVVLGSLTPPRGALEGGTLVVLRGSGFVNGFAQNGGLEASAQTTVTFGGNAAVSVNVIDDVVMEVKTPPGTAGEADVTVTNPNGSASCSKCFRYFQAISLTRLSPAQGSTRGGDTLTLTGKGFVPSVMVLVGGNAATSVQVAPDGTSLTAVTPPGTAGSADVGVIGKDSSAFLYRAFVYVAPMEVTSVSPPDGPVAGGTSVTLSGGGFTSDAGVSFGGVAATTVQVQSATTLVATAPVATQAGAVDVTVTTRRATATLPGAFAYTDDSRTLALYTVAPRQGPTAGGTCAQGPSTCVALTGAGFSSASGLQVRIGSSDVASPTVVDDHLIDADLPPGPPGVVDVQVRSTSGAAVLTGAFAYVDPLSLSGIAPAEADASASPPVTATIQGTGLSSSCEVWIGGEPATVTQAASDGTSLTVTVPLGSPGARDVRVTCGDPASPTYQEATLAGAFTYTSLLSILQVDPDVGAIAGNTPVTVYGSGFQTSLQVLFGPNPATKVTVVSPVIAQVSTPRGNVGMVDVTAQNDATHQAVLKAGYGYYDPTNINGGGSDGEMRGILNVTVLNSTPGMSGPVPGATIVVNDDQLTGLTDDRGQVDFADPALLKPVTITGTKPKFAASTIAHIDARDVTLYMQMNDGGPPSPPQPGQPPATFTGTVCGFKVAPDFQLQSGQDLEARVFISYPYVYAAPPFGFPETGAKVASDCGSFDISTTQFGPLALYAQFGVADNVNSTFTPLLMGVTRGLTASPGATTTANIVLDMHLDMSIPITVVPADAPPGQMVVNAVYSYLDLGGEGVVPLAETESTDNTFVFANHPRVDGDGLLFLNLAGVLDPASGSVSAPYSFFYRRQYGDPEAGVTIGPMLAFSQLTSPPEGGTFAGNLAWTFLGGQQADVAQVSVEEPAGLSMKPIWDVVVPGSDLSVALPQSALGSIDPGQTMFWTLTTADTPRFDFNDFGYQQLYVNSWTSFTQNYASFNTP